MGVGSIRSGDPCDGLKELKESVKKTGEISTLTGATYFATREIATGNSTIFGIGSIIPAYASGTKKALEMSTIWGEITPNSITAYATANGCKTD